uniref:TetR/AcrR family transcriptional regulator n=1 Tax=Sphingomonas bacterium TaxID=1895847 RepID=UPI00261110BB|nr:TetR/AcrR family transcriptional regulator [Sphingomonas bacterium]
MSTQETRPPTAERLIHAAMMLFMEKGYLSTSVADILREAGANSGSLYHAFPAKQDLLLAVLERYRQGIGPMLLDPAWAGVDDPIDRIFALLARYRAGLEMTECSYGCPIGSLALEIHEPDPPVRELLAANFDGWVAGVKTCLDAAADRLPAGTDTEALAQFVLTVMEGGVMQSRTHRTLRAFDASVASLRDYLDRLQAAR